MGDRLGIHGVVDILLNFSNFSSVSTWMGYHANTVIFLFLCTRGPSLILNKGMAMVKTRNHRYTPLEEVIQAFLAWSNRQPASTVPGS